MNATPSSASPDHPSAVPDPRYAGTEEKLGTAGTTRRAIGSAEAVQANIAWWDADADEYQATHGAFLGEADFLWCPEGLREQDVGLLGPVRGTDVLEIGCGAASCARWLAEQGARAVGMDVSAGMLRHAYAGNRDTGNPVPLVRGNAEHLPFAAGSFDTACSAFGAVPFVSSIEAAFTEVRRVLRPGGRWVFAVMHPIRWIFPDDPGPAGLTATQPYFDRTPYTEVDNADTPTYVEYHHTLGDYVRTLSACGLELLDLVEPEWPREHTREWGQWSPLRGKLFPGTAIFCCRAPSSGTS